MKNDYRLRKCDRFQQGNRSLAFYGSQLKKKQACYNTGILKNQKNKIH